MDFSEKEKYLKRRHGQGQLRHGRCSTMGVTI